MAQYEHLSIYRKAFDLLIYSERYYYQEKRNIGFQVEVL